MISQEWNKIFPWNIKTSKFWLQEHIFKKISFLAEVALKEKRLDQFFTANFLKWHIAQKVYRSYLAPLNHISMITEAKNQGIIFIHESLLKFIFFIILIILLPSLLVFADFDTHKKSNETDYWSALILNHTCYCWISILVVIEVDGSSIVKWGYQDNFKLVYFFYKKISTAQKHVTRKNEPTNQNTKQQRLNSKLHLSIFWFI